MIIMIIVYWVKNILMIKYRIEYIIKYIIYDIIMLQISKLNIIIKMFICCQKMNNDFLIYFFAKVSLLYFI